MNHLGCANDSEGELAPHYSHESSSLEFLDLTPNYHAPSAWWQHVPIAHWLVYRFKPRKIVELGTHNGTSFFSFCEAAAAYSPHTHVYAVDTWEGDEHSGSYGEDVFARVRKHWSDRHRLRSTLIKSTFDCAAEYFATGSIDLLHIDGLHTYDAVKHDLETWRPLLSETAIVVFHDINVRSRNFGVWKFWEEIKESIGEQCIEIFNGHGLGILFFDSNQFDKAKTDYADLAPAIKTKGLLLEQNNELRQRVTTMEGLLANTKRRLAVAERKTANTAKVHQNMSAMRERLIALMAKAKGLELLLRREKESASRLKKRHNQLRQNLANKNAKLKKLKRGTEQRKRRPSSLAHRAKDFAMSQLRKARLACKID